MDEIDYLHYFNQLKIDGRFVVVSNREPWMHVRDAEGIRVVKPASGMVTGIEPIIRALGGTWVAHGSASGDRLVVDAGDRVSLPPNSKEYTLRRVWLTRREEDGYYYGISNRALWPLCHIVYTRPSFSRHDWQIYRDVNQRFADAVLEEVGPDKGIIFIQDYHLALLPRFLKEANPNLKIVLFWHIPWPNEEVLRIFPWAEELLNGLLGADILGFHIQYHCNNFLSTVERYIEARVDYEHFRVSYGGHFTCVRPYPISVDFHQIGRDVNTPKVTSIISGFQKEIGHKDAPCQLIVGADRLDYTKGIPERIKAFELLLRQHPELHSRVIYLQLAAPTRTHIDDYRDLNEQIDDLVDQVNWRFQTEDWTPIHFLRAHHDYYAILAAYRMADVVVVSSLHDGMNLVAKEFVSARTDGDGILLLSKYTGAARELTEAVIANPFDVEELADKMFGALEMPEEERRRRMDSLRSQVEQNSIYNWGKLILDDIVNLPCLG